ncbi:MAG: photosynthetic complex assembly protein PuhC [Pseudomonadota bacterium]
MSHAARLQREKNDRIAMRAVFFMLCTIVLLVAAARLTDRPLAAPTPVSDIKLERVIQIQTTLAGAALVTEMDGTVVADLPTGKGVFISVIDRVVRRQRVTAGVSADGPVHLQLGVNNRLSLLDPSTGRRIELVSYGKDNVAAFRGLLEGS